MVDQGIFFKYSCIFFSKIFLLSTNPSLVLPKLLGPELVGVFLPMLRILILHSAGISSTSSSLSSLNALATEGLGWGAVGFLAAAFSFSCIPGFWADFKLIDTLEITGAGGALAEPPLILSSLGGELDLRLCRCSVEKTRIERSVHCPVTVQTLTFPMLTRCRFIVPTSCRVAW